MILHNIWDYFAGKYYIKIASKDGDLLGKILKKHYINIKLSYSEKEEKIILKIPFKERAKILGLLDKNGIKVYSIEGKGLIKSIKRYSKRYGIVVGILLFVFLLDYSDRFIWNIEVSGNGVLRDDEVISDFAECGFRYGTDFKKVDLYKLCNDVLEKTDNYSWVSVNIEGTTANIEVRERLIKNTDEEITASNLVAKYGGIIKYSTVSSGKIVVENEQTVAKGDLLVSGIVEKQTGFEIIRSKGSVFAEIQREFEVFQPYNTETEIYTGNEEEKLSVTFFGKRIFCKDKLSENFELYDEECFKDRLVLFDRIKLPVFFERIKRKEKYIESFSTGEYEAMLISEERINELISEELSNDDILYKERNFEKNDDGVTLKVSVKCISDIAEEKIIETPLKG